jgi:hypothetical protein
MHGLIFVELRKYVDDALGTGTWPKLLESAGLANKLYMPIGTYPDEELVALVSTAASLGGGSVDATLHGFGEFIAPDLLRMYSSRISKDWKTLDVIENTEETIHTVVRAQNPGADPPRLRCRRLSPEEVVISYSSPRKLCAVAKGIVRGLARDLRERVTITESSCMHKGAVTCEITVTLEAEAASGAEAG